ncbi:hypothetical protein D3C78_1431550 [compost metagenome]
MAPTMLSPAPTALHTGTSSGGKRSIPSLLASTAPSPPSDSTMISATPRSIRLRSAASCAASPSTLPPASVASSLKLGLSRWMPPWPAAYCSASPEQSSTRRAPMRRASAATASKKPSATPGGKLPLSTT